ncbi:helix-turn-helix domain-containing protein [Tenacibaculum maritimum]|uniref:helix-turn-helix domain-containing protein n=1 Tax=Tenacibaculum maritimum TaxID=107401 RepID=UPI0012E69736|nr:helix-turn-helix transcriptional regulator [Tenacibaculum maritimum]CAA0233560.1 Putative transcriptional regulator [Tenacibaculum maritimum]
MQPSYKKDDKIFLEQLGSRIRDLRLENGLSQEKLSFESDLDRTYIGSVERGERNIAAINLKKISKALNISISQLFNFDNE